MLSSYFFLFVKGTGVTVAAWLIASFISFLVGTFLGILSCRHINNIFFMRLIRLYTFVAKGIPAYVQILIAYFILPGLLEISVSGFVASTAALAFCSAGYTTEIVRSGINAIARGQWDACKALGYSFKKTLSRVILPQTFKSVAAMLFSESESLLKSTSLLATIGVTEITRTGMNIISRELNPLPVYLTIACIYLFFAGLVNLALIMVERRYSYGQR